MKQDWDNNPPWVQMMMLAYDSIRSFEEVQENYDFLGALAKAMHG